MKLGIRTIIISFIIFLISAVGYSSEKNQVMVLNSYHKGYSWADDLVEGIVQTLEKKIKNLEVRVEYMDTKRINTSEYQEMLFKLMKLKYDKSKPDVIIASDDNAFHYIIKYHGLLFADTPIVFMGVNRFELSMIKGHENKITGLVQDADITSTLRTALNLHPDVSQVAVIFDATTTGQAYRKQVSMAEPNFRNLKFVYLDGLELSTPEMLSRLRSLPDGSIALLCIWLKDNTGVFVPWKESYHKITKNSKVPVYGVLDTMLECGVVGGKVQSGKHHGIAAAKLALKLLKGEKIRNIPVSMKSPNKYMFDYKQLLRWKIPVSALPKESIILNEPKSFYSKYKRIVWGVIGVFSFMAITIVVLGINVVSRRRAESNLQKSEERIKAILGASPVGIGLLINRKLGWANEMLYSMIGFDQDSLSGQSPRVLYRDDKEYERMRQELYANISKTGTSHVDTQWVRKNGTVFDCTIHVCFLDPTEPSKGQIVAVVDTSEKIRLETQLRRAQKMEVIGILAGGVAHDLNNILSGLVSYPDLLLMQLPDDSPLIKPVLTIQESGQKAAAIVQDLLTLARRGVATMKVVNLNDIISEYLKSPEYKKLKSFHSGVIIKTDLKENLLNLSGSRVHLSKMVMNLVSNSAEAMPKGGRLSITTENRYIDRPLRSYDEIKEGDYVVFVVSDTGVGIPSRDIDRIFEPFFTKKKMGRSGTGLGMSVVWGAVKDHMGYIDIQSTQGKGSTFTLYFPATRQQLAKNKPILPPEAYMGQGESILVIDDVKEQREIASKLLSELGYSVTSVSRGEEAIEYLQSNSADLLVLDMIMDPGIDGLETYKKILKLNPGQKAIIASGFSETDRVKETQRLGAGEYIKKPYTLEKIGVAVREELEK